MIINRSANTNTTPPGKLGGHSLRLRQMFVLGVMVTAFVFTGRAANLTWNANTGGSLADGSGNWLGDSNWWTGSADQVWTNFSGAIFGSGSGAAGAYTVNVGTPVIVTNMLFQTPGSYVVTGTQITFSNSASGVTELTVNAGQTAEVDSFIVKNGGAAFLNSGGTLILGGGGTANSGQSGGSFVGTSPTTSTNIITGGAFSEQGSFHPDNITVNIINGGALNSLARLDLGRNGPAVINVGSAGQLNCNTGNANDDNANIQVSRGNRATLNLSGVASGLSSGSNKGGNVTLIPDSSSQATLNILPGATLNVGSGASGSVGVNSTALRTIRLVTGGMNYGVNAQAIINMSGGVVTAQNMVFGAASGGTYTNSPTNIFNLTGGTLYLAAPNISQSVNTGTNFGVNLSGGTIAAIANWSPACTVPINLSNVNGNVTFQAADSTISTPFNISLAGPLTGQGGFNKTGGGILTLSGANSFTGASVVNNGTLVVVTGPSTASGSITMDGSTATVGPTESVNVLNVSQYWAINGNLTYANGTPTADFNYGALPPSTSVAPIQVSGNVAFTVTPQVTVEGSAISTGVYPLIHYGIGVSGGVPTTPTLPALTTGYISNNAASQTIYLVVTGSPVSPGLVWGVGNGNWDLSTLNWLQFGAPTNFANGKGVTFDDTASGGSPITVSNVITASPSSVTVNNTAKAYTITGPGVIAGSAILTKKGSGALTLSGKNTYSGGTVVDISSGPVNINNGGDNSGANSAIGTGPLTLNLGATIDNTSGTNVTLMANNVQNWNDDFTFLGSAGLNLGLGQVNLGSGLVTVTVNANTLVVNNLITDNGNNFGIAKNGNGTLTLSNKNTFTGGVTLNAGTLNINSGGDGGADSALGAGNFTINAGTIDNTSGADVVIQTAIQETWAGSGNFTFLGTGNLDLGPGNIAMTISGLSQFVTVVSNTLSTEGAIAGNNRSIIKQGNGTLVLGGNLNDNNGLGLVVNAGRVNLNKTSSGLFHAVGSAGLTVNSNGLVVITGTGGDQVADLAPVVLSGGTFDLNGQSETVNNLSITNGTLRNSASAASIVRPWAGGTFLFTLGGTYADFDVASGGSLQMSEALSGPGSLLKTGGGTLILSSNNTFVGNTVINAGTLALTGVGSISNQASIILATNGTFVDVSASTDNNSNSTPILKLFSGQTLSGFGTVAGSLQVPAASTLLVGSASNIGVLTVTSNASLSGLTEVKLDAGNTTNDMLSVGGTLAYGGTLSVTNLSGTLTTNKSFKLFSAGGGYTGGFASITPATPGFGLAWNTSTLTTDGTLRLTAVSTVSTTRTNITAVASGNSLTLSWPADHLGWHLQAQTNAVSVGLSTNWVVVPGSDQVTTTNLTINPAAGSVFYRMVYP